MNLLNQINIRSFSRLLLGISFVLAAPAALADRALFCDLAVLKIDGNPGFFLNSFAPYENSYGKPLPDQTGVINEVNLKSSIVFDGTDGKMSYSQKLFWPENSTDKNPLISFKTSFLKDNCANDNSCDQPVVILETKDFTATSEQFVLEGPRGRLECIIE